MFFSGSCIVSCDTLYLDTFGNLHRKFCCLFNVCHSCQISSALRHLLDGPWCLSYPWDWRVKRKFWYTLLQTNMPSYFHWNKLVADSAGYQIYDSYKETAFPCIFGGWMFEVFHHYFFIYLWAAVWYRRDQSTLKSHFLCYYFPPVCRSRYFWSLYLLCFLHLV